MAKKGWKVVIQLDQEEVVYCSLFERYRPCVYGFKKWARPMAGWGPLCVFRSKYSATKFMREKLTHGLGYKLFSCEYSPSSQYKIWRKYVNGVTSRELHTMPRGTVLATRVRLLKK